MKSIKDVDQVYIFTKKLMSACQEQDSRELWSELDHAMRLGSSTLEILGAIRGAIINRGGTIEHLLGPTGKAESEGVIVFVDEAYGRNVFKK